MSELAIHVDSVSKRYRIGRIQQRHTTLRDAIVSGVSAPFVRLRRNGHSAAPSADEHIWSLKDVSFAVKRGEVVGIIGRNGAGKSTLLKILSRVTPPTKGLIRLYGRVGSLLEVGTGFHPELSGRENIYLNGAILGMRRAEINRKFDEIVAFAEIEKFLDTPVKHYSSGMYVRLAFAVAAHLEPEILVVDEVLAVGDATFQKKCLGKMGDVAKEGRTILFVSHNMTALKSLCHRAVWLDQGHTIMEGPTNEVVARYMQSALTSNYERVWPDPATAPGNDKARLRLARIVAEDGTPMEIVTVRTPLRMEFECWNFVPGTEISFGVNLYSADGTCVFSLDSAPLICDAGLVHASCQIPGDLLNDGFYRVSLTIVKDTSVPLYYYDEAMTFEVHDVERTGNWYGKWPGAVRPMLKWTIAQPPEPMLPEPLRALQRG